MKGLLYLAIGSLTFAASAQPYPLKNANSDYIVYNIYNQDLFQKRIKKFIRDKNGLYWILGHTEVFSFDGVHWKCYPVRSAIGKNQVFLINDIHTTIDGIVWITTEDGLYCYDAASETFIPVKEKFINSNVPGLAFSYITEGPPGKLLLFSMQSYGFFILDIATKTIRHVNIDPDDKIFMPERTYPVAVDKNGNTWGITANRKGIWHYDWRTGQVSSSWKNQLKYFADKRFQNVTSITYAQQENAIWLSYRSRNYIEKMSLSDGKSIFISFSGNLMVHQDSAAPGKHPVGLVKIDKDNIPWLRVGNDYLVKLNNEPVKSEYLIYDPSMLPIGNWQLFQPQPLLTEANSNDDEIHLWIHSEEKLSLLRKRNQSTRQLNFDTLNKFRIHPNEYDNADTRKTIFFKKGKNNDYIILQQNEGRPKLIALDDHFRIKNVLFNNEWKDYPAYFNPGLGTGSLFIAILHPGIEPLDFRKTVLKDFKVDLQTFTVQELNLHFKQRVWRYGAADKNNVYWLYSAGSLFSYNVEKDVLDSIYICAPSAKGAYAIEYIKGYDYPTVLHKPSSTFWISFPPSKELYKINLETRKIEQIFKTCLDQKNCNIPGGVYDMGLFNNDKIYLQLNFSAALIDPFSNQITGFNELFKTELIADRPMGAGSHKNWMYFLFPSKMYFFNTATQQRRELNLNEDYKWRLSQFNSEPLINTQGEMVLMSSGNGFIVLNPDSIPEAKKPGIIHLSYIRINNINLSRDSVWKAGLLSMKYKTNTNVHIGLSDYSVLNQEKISYEYCLYSGGDTVWIKLEGKPEITFTGLSAGKYSLLLRASNAYGSYSENLTSFPVIIIPPWWQTWWFKLVILAAIVMFITGLYMYRLAQLKKLQIIRNNIARDLHDDIGSTLNSISIYSEVAKQQAGKNIPALDVIGQNSRQIVESMSDIVWTINPENDSFEKIIMRMRSFAYQVLKPKNVEYTFDVDEKLNTVILPMQVRKNFYMVFKEGITNLVKYSGATRVSISLSLENRVILLKIRDNGIGIPVNPETQGNGLMNMQRRADEINAELVINSAKGEGTGIELTLKS